jgi:hypothetical protein
VTFPPTNFRLYPNSGRDCGGIGATISATFTFTPGGLPVDALIG